MRKRMVLIGGTMVMTLSGAALALGGAAQAQQPVAGQAQETLYTPPLQGGFGDRFVCRLVNVTQQTRTLRVLVKDEDGNVVRDSGSQDVLAGHSLLQGQILTNLPASDTAVRYCAFAVVNGPKTAVRGVGALIDEDVSNSDITAVAAQ